MHNSSISACKQNMGKYYALSRGLLTACCLSSCPSYCCFSKTFLVNCQGTGHFFFLFSFAILNSSSGHYVLCNSTANSPGLFNIYLVHSWNGINLSGDIKGAGRNQCRKIPAVYSLRRTYRKFTLEVGGGSKEIFVSLNPKATGLDCQSQHATHLWMNTTLV